MNKIRSRWAVLNKIDTNKEYDYILKHKYSRFIIYKIVENFIEKNHQHNFSEIYVAAQQGYWRAVKAYKSRKGNFGTYATHYCLSYINAYVGRLNQTLDKISCINTDDIDANNDVILSDNNKTSDDIENKIMVEDLLSKLKPKYRKILAGYYIDGSSRINMMDEFGGNKRIFNARLKRALKEARQVCCSEN